MHEKDINQRMTWKWQWKGLSVNGFFTCLYWILVTAAIITYISSLTLTLKVKLLLVEVCTSGEVLPPNKQNVKYLQIDCVGETDLLAHPVFLFSISQGIMILYLNRLLVRS